ncbi:MAG: metalloendopeptidase-like rane protein [Rhodocyclaceae bacterium]|nr:metalloendopeptidase-like rane protein [Rhodocyclaceae bacterium]
MPRHVVAAVLLLIGLVFATSVVFSWLSVHLRLPLVQELVLSLQQRETQKTQEFVRSNLQLMATRVGELQAQVLQLDSLGERLSSLAGIKKEAPREANRPAGQGGPFIAATPLSTEELQREIERLSRVVDSKADELAALETRLLEKRVRDRLLPTTLPVKEAFIGSGFGYRSDPFNGTRALHEGLDFNAEAGTPVYAAAAGAVAVAERHPEFGNMIDIDHGDGLVSRYAHLSQLLVKPGQIVRRGDPIGAVGSTGRSTGAHLHFEVRMLGVAQNPTQFLKRGDEFASLKKR